MLPCTTSLPFTWLIVKWRDEQGQNPHLCFCSRNFERKSRKQWQNATNGDRRCHHHQAHVQMKPHSTEITIQAAAPYSGLNSFSCWWDLISCGKMEVLYDNAFVLNCKAFCFYTVFDIFARSKMKRLCYIGETFPFSQVDFWWKRTRLQDHPKDSTFSPFRNAILSLGGGVGREW
jgi:hypothetical protein